MEINQKYNIKATVISPLSIGQGADKDWVEGIDYIRKDKILYHLNLKLMVEAGIPMDKLSALYADGKVDDIRHFLEGKLEDIHDFALDMPISSANPVKSFYFNPLTGKYTLFGSSLKGAVRSALFHALTRSAHNAELKDKGPRLNEYVFGRILDGSDLMRFIRIGDFDFEETALVNTKIYNLQKDRDNGGEWIGGWKHDRNHTTVDFNQNGFNTVYECLMPGEQSTCGSILISPLLYRRVLFQANFRSQKDSLFAGSPIRQLFQCINEATRDYIRKEIQFFEEFSQGDNADRILTALHKYESLVHSFIQSGHSECLIKMAAGTGFHAITGDWQYRDYTEDPGYNRGDGKKRYKSRKIACYDGKFTPLGFLKLSVID